MNYTPTVDTVLKKLERPGSLFTADELRVVLTRVAELEAALRITLPYGLAPHDVSGEREWARARAALIPSAR